VTEGDSYYDMKGYKLLQAGQRAGLKLSREKV